MNTSLKEIAQIVVKSDVDFVEAFLQQILTKDEAKALGQRWEIIKLLKNQMPQREIAKQLGTSLCKITRGSRELKKANSALIKALQKHERIK